MCSWIMWLILVLVLRLSLDLSSLCSELKMLGVILALQSSFVLIWRVDNLGVVRHVGRQHDGRHGSIPLELLWLIDRMLHLRGLDTVRITKIKGHADEGVVLDGRVREVERFGNDAAAGSLDGWSWRELKVLPVAWYDQLARILAMVEDTGVWPDGFAGCLHCHDPQSW